MEKIIDKIFKNRIFVFSSLINYGFKKIDETYVYQTKIIGAKMQMEVAVKQQKIEVKVFDCETGDEYVLHLTDAVGKFVGLIREEYEAILKDIANKCTSLQIYNSEVAKDVINYVNKKYSDELEFLWKNSESAICRRKDNQKWYAVFQKVSKSKLGEFKDDFVEIIDLREVPQIIDKIVDNDRIFRGFHMNKNHWITICLDGSVSKNQIYEKIDKSYVLAGKK